MLSSGKQYVDFVPDGCPEHLGVAQESPGLPACSEDQARQSVVVPNLQGHLWEKKDRRCTVRTPTLKSWVKGKMKAILLDGGVALSFNTAITQPLGCAFLSENVPKSISLCNIPPASSPILPRS